MQHLLGETYDLSGLLSEFIEKGLTMNDCSLPDIVLDLLERLAAGDITGEPETNSVL